RRDQRPAIPPVPNVKPKLRDHQLRPRLVHLNGKIMLQLRRTHMLAHHLADCLSPFCSLHRRPPETKMFAPCRWYIEFVVSCQLSRCGTAQNQTMSIRENLSP